MRDDWLIKARWIKSQAGKGEGKGQGQEPLAGCFQERRAGLVLIAFSRMRA